eukprot:2314777-Lingulodinium_polyedra.AAC.1
MADSSGRHGSWMSWSPSLTLAPALACSSCSGGRSVGPHAGSGDATSSLGTTPRNARILMDAGGGKV